MGASFYAFSLLAGFFVFVVVALHPIVAHMQLLKLKCQ
jgi:hypothetical protein